ncbi:MAG: chemotaxis protein CheD [Gammaproteobacteria bacterium]|nr:chemotaxis protein CheD [Gammaproteobacteria bacterium]
MKEVFLRPGEFYFGEADTRIRTILGSCVAITMWHPRRRVGGMCHYMLPRPGRKARSNKPDGRYAEDAIQLFLDELAKRSTKCREYQIKVFGGGNMFPTLAKQQINNIGERNMKIGQELLRVHGFRIHTTHMGGPGYRRIVFNVNTGEVQVYHHLNNQKKYEKKV